MLSQPKNRYPTRTIYVAQSRLPIAVEKGLARPTTAAAGAGDYETYCRPFTALPRSSSTSTSTYSVTLSTMPSVSVSQSQRSQQRSDFGSRFAIGNRSLPQVGSSHNIDTGVTTIGGSSYSKSVYKIGRASCRERV